jgi:hypothetical protein
MTRHLRWMRPVCRHRSVALLLATFVVVAGAGCGTTTVPPSSPTTTPSVRTPAGWVVHVYQHTAIAVPRTWMVVNEPLCPPRARVGLLTLGIYSGPLVAQCPAADTSANLPSVTVAPLIAATSDGQRPASAVERAAMTLNHLRVTVGPCRAYDTVWTIPALDVELQGSGGGGVGDQKSGASTLVNQVLHSVHQATPAEIATSSPLAVHLSIAHRRVAAGVPIKAMVTFSNTTGEDILVDQCAVNGWPDVGLTGIGITFAPVRTEIGCAPTVLLHPGATSFPETISTSYEQCSEPGIPAPGSVTCLGTGPPPLPAGAYRTDVITAGLPDDTAPANVLTVHLTG